MSDIEKQIAYIQVCENAELEARLKTEEERTRLNWLRWQGESGRRQIAEHERDEIKADYHNMIRKANTAEWERDEARGVAREMLREYIGDAGYPERYDWLAPDPSADES